MRIRTSFILVIFMVFFTTGLLAQTDQLTKPSNVKKVEAIQAKNYMDNAKIKPLMFVTDPMPMSHSTPKEVFGEIGAGRGVYLVDLNAALAYFDTLTSKAKETGIAVPALANLRKSVAAIIPPKQDEVVVSELGQGFYLVALPLLAPKPIDELFVAATNQLVKKGLIVKGAVVINSQGNPTAKPPIPDTPQFLIFFTEVPPVASKA